MEIKVVIKIEGLGKAYAKSLLKAIRPDDSTVPQWLQIREKVEGDALLVEVVTTTSRRVRSLRNTVDELLSFLYATLRTLEEVAKTKSPSTE